MEAGGDGIDHRGRLPGGEEFRASTSGNRAPRMADEAFVAEFRVVAEAAPEHPVVPVLVNSSHAATPVPAEELAAPDPVRAVVEAPRDFVGNVLDELADEVRSGPAEVVASSLRSVQIVFMPSISLTKRRSRAGGWS